MNGASTALHYDPSSVLCRRLGYSILDYNFEWRFRPSAGLRLDDRLDWLFDTFSYVLLWLSYRLDRFLNFRLGWVNRGSEAIDRAHHIIELSLQVKLLVTQVQLLFDVICFNLKR